MTNPITTQEIIELKKECGLEAPVSPSKLTNEQLKALPKVAAKVAEKAPQEAVEAS